ncbi:MAG TPA: sorbosone dehydrogenase family protein [Casimicrobiaceae bacterium]|jgi:glucose/arabinose dehydrogenase|nr:sorbosone dehydrogenase family protein [Casimicrobiaceae bacterium]
MRTIIDRESIKRAMHGRPIRTLALAFICVAVPACAQTTIALDKISLPPGFKIEVLARLDNPRAMALGAEGTLFVGSMRAGNVYAITLRPGAPARVITIASGLNRPIGVAFRGGALYASATDRILRFDDIEHRLDAPAKPVVVSSAFPNSAGHGGKFIAFGPDGKLYVPSGAPCNICEPDPDRYANLMRMNPDGSALEVFARGIRNTVGFDWDPDTHELWFTDNGRDMLGDDAPPDELNHATRLGMHFGYPYCHGGTIADPQFGSEHSCAEFAAPAQNLGPHVASLGMRFYTGAQFPAAYRKQIFIAEHGSWNRSRKIGYRVSVVRIEGGRAVSYQPFATGWLQGEQAWGRPADVLVMPDGSLLVSDDYAGAIYRISYSGTG